MFQRIDTLEKEKRETEDEFQRWKNTYTHNVPDCPMKVCMTNPTAFFLLFIFHLCYYTVLNNNMP